MVAFVSFGVRSGCISRISPNISSGSLVFKSWALTVTPPRIFLDFDRLRIDFFFLVLLAFCSDGGRRREYFLGILRLLLVTRKKNFLIIFSTKPNEIYLKLLRCRGTTYRWIGASKTYLIFPTRISSQRRTLVPFKACDGHFVAAVVFVFTISKIKPYIFDVTVLPICGGIWPSESKILYLHFYVYF